MTTSGSRPDKYPSREEKLLDILDEYETALRAGRFIPHESLLAEHPDLADEIKDCLKTLDMIAAVDARSGSAGKALAAEGHAAGQSLGDYQLIREIGRGGMGIVYEARQVSLNKRVALKLLPFAAVFDTRRLDRFKNEALAAAHLDHPHIVEVSAFNCDRGVHFYVMRFVDGSSLEKIIAQLRSARSSGPGDRPAGAAATEPAELPGTGRLNLAGSPTADTAPLAALKTFGADEPDAYFRHIARLGIQAAEALEHAHERGIIHRDIKPSNLLVDSNGKLWITDFGLARMPTDAALTLTGDLVGTLRYMSPEQTEGKAAVVDHRTDIYSLGATIYELMTLKPAHPAEDREALLHEVRSAYPVSPRKLRKEIPQDLETIVLKAMEIEPEARYASAGEMAADLQRFVARQAILARRPSLVTHFRRLVRQHPLFLSATTAVALVVTAAFAVAWWQVRQSLRGERQARLVASQQSDLAAQRLNRARRAVFNLELNRVASLWHSQPQQATQLLLDSERCPPELRDFTWGLLYRACQLDERQWLGHPDGALCVAWSPDGSLVASGGKDNLVRLWDPTTGDEIGQFAGHEHWVTAVAISPDGKTLASASRDHSLRLWDLPSLELRHVCLGHRDRVTCVDFSHDGRSVVSGSLDGDIRVWDAASGEFQFHLEAHEGGVTALACSPLVFNVATLGVDQLLRIWDLTSRQSVNSRTEHRVNSDVPLAIAFAPDGRLFASAGPNDAIYLWQPDLDEPIALQTFESPVQRVPIRAICFSPDGETLASSSDDGLMVLWDIHTRRVRRRWQVAGSFVRALSFSPDGERIVGACFDGTLRTWSVKERLPNTILSGRMGPIHSLALAPDKRTLAAAGWDEAIHFWDIQTQRPAGELRVDTGAIKAAYFSPDGRWLAAGATDGAVYLWDWPDRHSITALGYHPRRVIDVVFSPDSRLLVSAGRDGLIKVWSVEDRTQVAVLSGHTNSVYGIGFSPDGTVFASASRDGTVRLWDAKSWRERAVHRHELPIGTVVFSPDGKTLATTSARPTPLGGFTGEIQLCDAASLMPLLTLRGHDDEVNGIAFSPDGQTIASGGADNVVRLWDVHTGEQRAVLEGHSDRVYAVHFAAGGRELITSSRNGTIMLWSAYTADVAAEAPSSIRDVPTAKKDPRPAQTLAGHTAAVKGMTFSPDGHLLASTSDDGTLRLWNTQSWISERILHPEGGCHFRVVCSPDGKLVAAVSMSGKVQIWDAETGELVRQIAEESAILCDVAFLGDGEHLITSDSTGQAALWEAATGRLMARPATASHHYAAGIAALPGMKNHAVQWCQWRLQHIDAAADSLIAEARTAVWQRRDAALSPDGHYVATISHDVDEPIIIWSATTLTPVVAIRGHVGPVDGAAFTGDGQFLATVGQDGTVRFWDVPSGVPRAILRPSQSDATTSVAASPDGRYLAVACEDFRIRVWEMGELK